MKDINSTRVYIISFLGWRVTSIRMKCTIKAFGITREIVGSKVLEIEVPEGQTVAGLKEELMKRFPAFSGLRSMYIAVNQVYGEDESVLKEGDEIALIPPVSGG
jgi:molybdopterin converting factor subunit 1